MTKAKDFLADIAKARRARIAAHKADPTKVKPWPDLAKLAATFRPTTEEEWEGRARMARARRPEDRDDIDLLALTRYPEPRSAFFPEAPEAAAS